MSETEKLADARAAIEDARDTIARDRLLTPDFKATAAEVSARILAGLQDRTIEVDRATSLAKSLVEAALIQSQSAEVESRGRRTRVAA